MRLLKPMRMLSYGQIASIQRDGGVLAIEDVAVPILKLPGGGGAVTSATATSARPRGTIEGRRLRGKIS